MYKVGIYDLFGSRKYIYCELDPNRNFKKGRIYSKALRNILINKKINTNSKPYLINNKYVDIDYNSFQSLLNSSMSTSDSQNLIMSLDKMLLKLIQTKLDITLKKNLGSYFVYQKGLLKKYFIEKQIVSEKIRMLEDEVIIPVFDNLKVDSQELLLSKFGNRSNTTLLWRSVAACLGSEELYAKYNIQDNDSILVVDSFDKALIVTKLDLSKNGERLIPCHKSYLDSYNALNTDYYQKYKITNKPSLSVKEKYEENYLKSELQRIPYKTNDDLWEFKDLNKNRNQHPKFIQKIDTNKNVKLILVLSKDVKIECSKNIVHYCNNETVKIGSIRFSSRIQRGEIAYYDQCEGLHIVSQNKKIQYDANLQFSTLIEENGKVAGGQEIIGKTNTDLFIKKGENSVKFYLRIGNKDKDGELKLLEQTFGNTRLTEKCNLILKPRMKPGQGRAIVEIECKTEQEVKPFEKVTLDWNKLSNTKDTINSLLSNRPLSYPPPIGRVKAHEGLTNSVKSDLIDCLNKNFYPNLNKPIWPNKYKKSVDRFQRENIFGNEPRFRLPATFGEDGRLVRDFLSKLNKDYLNTKAQSVLKTIAWTYQGKSQGYFNDIIDMQLNTIERRKMDAVSASFFANMIEDNRDLTTVFNACYHKISHNYTGITNYLRCLYQILMYYEFIYSNNIQDRDCVLLMKHLSNIYEKNIDNQMTSKYALLSMLFLLKRRKANPKFCRKENRDGLYQHVFRVLDIKTYRYDNEKLCTIIKDFINGEGSIEGIPLE